MHFDIRKIKNLTLSLDTLFIQELYKHAIYADKQPATVGKVINGKYTTEYDKWCSAEFVDYSMFSTKVEIIKEKCLELIETNYNVKCLESEIHFLHYKNGAEYKPHIDGQYIENNIAKRGADRDITCVVYLNDDYKGGEINFNIFNLEFKPKQGEILIYPTTWEYTHSVSKVIGNRIAIVFWFKTNPELNIESILPDTSTAQYLKSLIGYS